MLMINALERKLSIAAGQHKCINNTLSWHNRPKARSRDDPGGHWDFPKRQEQKNNTQVYADAIHKLTLTLGL